MMDGPRGLHRWLLTIAPPGLFLVLIALATSAHAQTPIKVPAAPDSKLDYLEPVVVPSARCMAVGDVAGWLAVGHKDSTVSLFRLDDKGKPAAQAVSLTLPRPATLAKHKNYPLALVIHPKRPLLVVWQDIEFPQNGDRTAFKDFDHLLLYRLDGKEPALVQSFARGDDFILGATGGSLAFDAAQTRLYVPNLRMTATTPGNHTSVGWFPLDAEGMPVAAKLRKPPGAPSQYDLACGLGFVPVSDDLVIFGAGHGPCAWDASSRRAPFHSVIMHPLGAFAYRDRIAGHPTLPVVYDSVLESTEVGSIEHADGYLTGVPQRADFEGYLVMKSAPVVLARRGFVAVGSVNKVLLIALDAQGRYKPSRVQAEVMSAAVEALAYSEKFDRLYVPVEKRK
jgi:hypothetical protein